MGRSTHNLYPFFRNIYINKTLYKYNNTMWIRITTTIIMIIKIIITGIFKSKMNRKTHFDITLEKYIMVFI